MNIRIATPEDAFAIQNIYRYYVDNTAITFELEVPSVKEFQERITKTLERYPYLVAEEEGEVIAYAYAGIFYDRRAYDWSAEMSVFSFVFCADTIISVIAYINTKKHKAEALNN